MHILRPEVFGEGWYLECNYFKDPSVKDLVNLLDNAVGTDKMNFWAACTLQYVV
jgi:hypothetical protein